MFGGALKPEGAGQRWKGCAMAARFHDHRAEPGSVPRNPRDGLNLVLTPNLEGANHPPGHPGSPQLLVLR